MFSYVARQAILDRDQTLFSYELLFKDGRDNCFPDTPIDEVVAKLLEDNLPKLPLEEITGGTLSFINFYLDTLLARFPNYLKAKHSIIEIIETESITPKLKKACEKYKQLGFKIALDNHDLSIDWSELYPFIDFVKVDAQSCDKQSAHHQRYSTSAPSAPTEKNRHPTNHRRYKCYTSTHQIRPQNHDTYYSPAHASPDTHHLPFRPSIHARPWNHPYYLSTTH